MIIELQRQDGLLSQCVSCIWVLICVFAISLIDIENARSDDDWTEDVQSAVKRAEAESKDLLLLYTGSDWCPPCKKLEEEVLSKEEFLREAAANMVLVKFDFPQQIKQSDDLIQQNKEWGEKYAISGYPTIVLVDKNLLPFGIVGYEPGGFQPYLGHLEELRQKRIRRDEAFAKSEKASGLEKAKFLDEGLSQLDEQIAQVYYADKIEQIVELDADNELGLRSKWFAQQEAEMRKLIITDILAISRLEKPDRAVAFIDEVLNTVEFPLEQKFEVLQIKLNLLHSSGSVGPAQQLLDEMINMEGLEGLTRERLIVKKAFQTAGSGNIPGGLEIIEQNLPAAGSGADGLYLTLAKAQLLDNSKRTGEAIALLDAAMAKAKFIPDLLIELVAARADMLCSQDQHELALQALDTFADDPQMPTDLRCEALLHKAMIMRETGRRRPALLSENRAIEVADTPELKREIQRVVEQLRNKFDDQ
jgi:thioredoxin-related protein